MKTLFRKFTFLTILCAVGVAIPVTHLPAEEVDFSCISYQVKGKIQVSTHRKEYDIVLENSCPGSVYWSMCIELMDPWTNEIQVALTPSGKLEMEKQSRVNLQMKNLLDESRTRYAFQSFLFVQTDPSGPGCFHGFWLCRHPVRCYPNRIEDTRLIDGRLILFSPFARPCRSP